MCLRHLDIEHRLTKPATVRRCHYDDHAQFERHFADYVAACNFGPRLETLKGRTPDEFTCKRWATEPHRVTLDPLRPMPGLNI